MSDKDGDSHLSKLTYSSIFLQRLGEETGLTPKSQRIEQPIFETNTTKPEVQEVPAVSVGRTTRNGGKTTDPTSTNKSLGTTLMEEVINKYGGNAQAPTDQPTEEEFKKNRDKTVKTKNKKPTEFAITPLTTPANVASLRKRFVQGMSETTFRWTKNNVASSQKFTAEEIETITDFIFETTFGTTGLKHAAAVVRAYRALEESDTPIPATMTAARLAQDEKIPAEFRQFYRLYNDCTKDQLAHQGVLRQLLKLHDNYQLYNNYLIITEGEKAHLRNFLTAAGFTTARGRGWSSVVHSYISTTLGLTTIKLRNMLQEYQCIHLMVSQFGVGILVLLPGNITNL